MGRRRGVSLIVRQAQDEVRDWALRRPPKRQPACRSPRLRWTGTILMRHIAAATSPKAAQMDQAKLTRFIDQCWGDEIVPRLVDYIRIPNKSPAFDREWAQHGHMDAAVELLAGWAKGR